MVMRYHKTYRVSQIEKIHDYLVREYEALSPTAEVLLLQEVTLQVHVGTVHSIII
jgi:hypothetical protein